MAIGKYSSGKSTGTSDRKSSGRLSSPGGATGSPIQKFKLGGTTTPTDKLKISQSDYFQAQPLQFPSIKIPDVALAPDNSQDLKNLAQAFGDVNTKLQAFTSTFWPFQEAMDDAARKRAEREEAEGDKEEDGEESNTKLNQAKNALAQKAENDPEAAAAYGVFASMDQRVERERVIVKAKNKLLGEIANLENVALEIYEESTVDESRKDNSGEIIPINPSTPEWRETILEHLKGVADNPQAYLELNDRVQGALLNATRSVSKIHAEYKDNKAKSNLLTIFSNISLDLKDASPKRLQNGAIPYSPEFISATDEITKWRSKSGISFKGYQDSTAIENLLTTAATAVFNTSDPNDPGQLAQNIKNMELVLLNTNLGAGEGQSLKEIAMKGDKDGIVLKRYWKAAVSEIKNDHTRKVDVADQNSAEKAGSAMAYQIIQRDNDGNLSTPEVDDLGVNATFTVGDKSFTIKRPPNAVNLQGVLAWARDQKIASLDIYSTALEQQAYAKAIDEVVDSWMETKGVGQQNANDAWLRNRILTSNNSIETEALINHFGNERWISRDQKNQLLQNNTLQTKLKTQREDFQKAVKKDYESIEARLVGIYQNMPLTEQELKDGYKPNETLPENWPPRLRSAYRARIEAFKQEAEETFGALNDDTYEDRILKITKAREDLIKNIDNEEAKLTNQKQEQKEEKKVEPAERISVEEHAALDKEERKNYRPIGNKRGKIFSYERKPSKAYEAEGSTLRNYLEAQGLKKLFGFERGRGDDRANEDLKTEVQTTPIYDQKILQQQINRLEDLAEEFPNGIDWERLSKESGYALRVRTDLDYKALNVLLERTGLTPKEFFESQINAHGLPMPPGLLDTLFPDPKSNISLEEFQRLPSTQQNQYESDGRNKFKLKKNNEQASSILDRGTLVAGTNLEGVLPNPKQELETQMLDLIHSGESTVDVKGGGYEAFNQGGEDEGKTVLGFSGTYGDHPANKGKKLTEMTIQQILDIQDSGYDFKTYPKGEAGTKKWHDSGGIHAAGRYQFIRSGLRDAMELAGIKPTEKFTPEIQDRLAIALLVNRGPEWWTSMKGNKELIELLEQYKKPETEESSTISPATGLA